MEDRIFLTNNHPTDGISDTFRYFFEALVEEVVLNGEPFDARKKWLCKLCGAEGVDYATIEKNLEDLFQVIEEWRDGKSRSSLIAAGRLAKECHLSDTALQTLFDQVSQKVENSANGHEYVDLDLPSGTLWATCNIGATKPEDFGGYFAWGETIMKNKYNWTTYKYSKGDSDLMTKYCNESDCGYNGFIDNLIELQTDDDLATANWGSGWQIPSYEQWRELLANTTNELTTQNGVSGMLITAKNGERLFLPAAGDRCWGDDFDKVGIIGIYWSSSLNTFYPDGAWNFNFSSCYFDYGMDCYERRTGHSVRAVRSTRRDAINRVST